MCRNLGTLGPVRFSESVLYIAHLRCIQCRIADMKLDAMHSTGSTDKVSLHFQQMRLYYVRRVNCFGHKYEGKYVQGCIKRTFPGCVKLGEKVAFYLPTPDRRTHFFHPIFTQPGKGILVHPCKGQ